jgi:ATP-dependent helicase HrpB
MQHLPIDDSLPELLAQLQSTHNLVLEAPPGTGKTTRVPPALLQLTDKEIWVLEPRRLAARLAAKRVADERNERLGETVGYQVRCDEVSSPRTRIRFLTEGVLTRRLLSDASLQKAGVVILDEFHERHLQTDLALALLRRLQQTARPDLKLVVMSATLAAAPVVDYLQAATLRAEGQRFDVTIEFAAREDQRPLAEQIARTLQKLLADKLDGDVLVFLPGAAEIRRAQSACERLAREHDLLLLPLHGELAAAEQDRAVRPAEKRKVILSTNVAESSVTIDGVVAVIDSGLARIAGHSPWSGLATLTTQRISQAAATQRAGRAGRTRAGCCRRLYTQADFQARPLHEAPDIQRLDLAEAALALHAAGVKDLSSFNWFEAPNAQALSAAETLLRKLGAVKLSGELTETGQAMLRFPLHPRQARLLVEAQRRGVAAAGCVLAALLGERDLAARNLFSNETATVNKTQHRVVTKSGPSDLFERLDWFAEAERANFSASRLRDMCLDVAAVQAVERVSHQLQRNLSHRSYKSDKSHENDEALLLAILAGYPDRVARRRSVKSDNPEVLLSGGGAAQLSRSSVVWQSEFLVAIDAEEKNKQRLIRQASAIEPEWLIELFADELQEVTEARWNAQAERVEVVQRLLYDQLVIDETRVQEIKGEQAAKVLAEAALQAGLQRFAEPERLTNFLNRVAFLATAFPEAGIPELNDADVTAALVALCEGLRSFSELRAAASQGGLLDTLKARLTHEQQRLLAQHTPESMAIAGRRQVTIHYEPNQPPWMASRLQDFFGMRETPRIAQGRVPLTLHLLAPNQRPVQVTSDLAGFWTRHYPAIRKELSRRYPRHAWPENPLQPKQKG